MNLADLVAYAREKYQITEQYKWDAFPGFSVLCDPRTGKWAALLMRQWDSDSGAQIELCDIKCGANILPEISVDYVTKAFRMQGVNWAGIRFTEQTEPKIVFALFDRAMRAARQQGYTVVLDNAPSQNTAAYQETALPHPGPLHTVREIVPDMIRKMRQLGDHKYFYSHQVACKTFYLQGKFMEDYTDDAPWKKPVNAYSMSYNGLTIRELRGYFTWRTAVRQGRFESASSAYATIYLYELLNQIGVSSPQDSLDKMRAFEVGYLDAGYGSEEDRAELHRWMADFIILFGLHPEDARQYFNPNLLARDGAMAMLRDPTNHPDDEVFSALSVIGGEKLTASMAVLKSPVEGKALFARAWKRAYAEKMWNGKNLFGQCFGEMTPFPWHPLGRVMYWERRKLKDTVYHLNPCRTYAYKNGEWQVYSYETLYFDRDRFFAFLHETDRQLRLYLKTGHPLKAKASEAWASPFVESAIEAFRREKEKAARPKIVLNLGGLEQIRRDALITRDSLLTEEEKREMNEPETEEAPEMLSSETPQASSAVALDETQLSILRALLAGEDISAIIRENHLLPSVVADGINEAFFEEIGDSVAEDTGSGIALVEDYIDDIQRLLGG